MQRKMGPAFAFDVTALMNQLNTNCKAYLHPGKGFHDKFAVSSMQDSWRAALIVKLKEAIPSVQYATSIALQVRISLKEENFPHIW